MDNKSKLAQAVINVMNEVENIEKNMNVGTGGSSYKGVADKDVKLIIGNAMRKNGLSLLPIGVEPKTTIERWEETTQYGNNPPVTKSKQSVFTEVKTKYLLLHSSGESIELEGYGQGVDSQDKGAGKATTYALKYTLLYSFLVPTGEIDDADRVHSNAIEVPQAKQKVTEPNIDKAPSSLVNAISVAMEKVKSVDDLTKLSKTDDGKRALKYPELKAMFTAKKLQFER